MLQRGKVPSYKPLVDVSPRDGISFVNVLFGTMCMAAFILSIIAFSNSFAVNTNNNNELSNTRLALYDTRNQHLSSNTTNWVTVLFDKQTRLSPYWQHIIGTGIIRCLRSGTYVIHFSLNTVLPNISNASFQCKTCNAWVEAQCILNSNVVLPSVVFEKPVRGPIQATFMVNTFVGDIIQIQFKSHCQEVLLLNVTQKRLSHFNDPMASASLLIY